MILCMPKKQKKLLELYGLTEKIHDNPHQLSYGEKKRLNLISTLVFSPSLLLLDEIFIGQDVYQIDYILEKLKFLRENGMTIIAAIHDPALMKRMADRILFLEDGKMAFLSAFTRSGHLVAGEWVRGLSTGEGYGVMKKITYSPANTLLHALHPFTKFSLLLGLSVLVFFIDSPVFMVLLFMMLLAAFLTVCRNPLAYFGMRTTFLTALTIGIIQCIFVQQGSSLVNIFGLSITNIGIQRAILISIRFLVIILSSYLFILTTSPSDFAFAFMPNGGPLSLRIHDRYIHAIGSGSIDRWRTHQFCPAVARCTVRLSKTEGDDSAYEHFRRCSPFFSH